MAEQSDWIEWRGGACPLPRDTLIDVKTKDGRQLGVRSAWLNDWDNPELGAYRVVSS